MNLIEIRQKRQYFLKTTIFGRLLPKLSGFWKKNIHKYSCKFPERSAQPLPSYRATKKKTTHTHARTHARANTHAHTHSDIDWETYNFFMLIIYV